MNAIWKYIEAHPEEWGATLLILPVSLVVYVYFLICVFLGWVMQ